MRQKRPEITSESLARIEVSPVEKQAAEIDAPAGRSEEAWFEAQKNLLDLKEISNNIAARKGFGVAIFALVCVYLAAVLTIVLLAGFGKIHLSDAVLLGLLGSGSANVIGVFHYVAKYFFKMEAGAAPRAALKPSGQPQAAKPARKPIGPKSDPPDTKPTEPDERP